MAVSEGRPAVILTSATAGQAAYRPDAEIKVAADPSTLLFDTFESVDTTNTWTLGGTTLPTGASGVLTLAAGTVALAQSYARSQPAFIPAASAYLAPAMLVTIDAATVTGNKRIWGLGIPNATPTVAVPITNGAVFEVQDTDGALIGAVYSGSARTQTVALTRPTDGIVHRYALFYKASRVYFEIDNVAVGSIAFPNPAVSALPLVIASVNGAATLGANATLTSTLMGVADTGRNTTQISDGTYPWRKTAVDAAGRLSVSVTDLDAATSGTISATDAVLGTHGGAGVLLSGTPTASSYVALAMTGGDSGFVILLTGTFGGGTVWFECSADATTAISGNWTTLSCRVLGTTGSTVNDSVTIAGLYRGNASGMAYLRVRVTGATAPSIAVVIRATGGGGPVALNAPIPAGTQTIGAVSVTGSPPLSSQFQVEATISTTTATTQAVTFAALTAAQVAQIDSGSIDIFVDNSGTGQNVTAVALSSTDTIGAHVATIPHANDTTTYNQFLARTNGVIATNTVGVMTYHLSLGLLRNVSVALTWAAAPTAAQTVTVRLVFHGATQPSMVLIDKATNNPLALKSDGAGSSDALPLLPVGGRTPGTGAAAVTHNFQTADTGAMALHPGGSLTAGTASMNIFSVRLAQTAAVLNSGVPATLLAAPGAGLSIYVTEVNVANVGTATLVQLTNGLVSATTPIFDLWAAINTPINYTFRTPLRLTAATALGLFSSVASTTLYVNVRGYYAP